MSAPDIFKIKITTFYTDNKKRVHVYKSVYQSGPRKETHPKHISRSVCKQYYHRHQDQSVQFIGRRLDRDKAIVG